MSVFFLFESSWTFYIFLSARLLYFKSHVSTVTYVFCIYYTYHTLDKVNLKLQFFSLKQCCLTTHPDTVLHRGMPKHLHFRQIHFLKCKRKMWYLQIIWKTYSYLIVYVYVYPTKKPNKNQILPVPSTTTKRSLMNK